MAKIIWSLHLSLPGLHTGHILLGWWGAGNHMHAAILEEINEMTSHHAFCKLSGVLPENPWMPGWLMIRWYEYRHSANCMVKTCGLLYYYYNPPALLQHILWYSWTIVSKARFPLPPGIRRRPPDVPSTPWYTNREPHWWRRTLVAIIIYANGCLIKDSPHFTDRQSARTRWA